MPILIRTDTSTTWQRATKSDFEDEDKLQRLLHESPELIREDEDRPIVFTREAALPGSGYSDLIGVDSSGAVVLVETKLARNPGVRREVIGQIVEYAAYLWGQSYSFLDELFQQREGKSIFELLSTKVPDLDAEEFQTSVTATLAAGEFQLMIVVDQMNAELEKIIAYLSSRRAGLTFKAVALPMYRSAGVEVLAPQHYGQLKQPILPPPPVTLSVQEIINRSPDDHTRRLLEQVSSSWATRGHEVEPKTKGFSCRADIEGKPQPIFWAYPDWGLEPVFDICLKRGAPEEGVKRYRLSCSTIRGFDSRNCLTLGRPITAFRQLGEDTVGHFLDAAEAFVSEWRTATALGHETVEQAETQKEQTPISAV
ncbi:MAG: hypothetical protein WA628_00705 [Terriglobales bacterium]